MAAGCLRVKNVLCHFLNVEEFKHGAHTGHRTNKGLVLKYLAQIAKDTQLTEHNGPRCITME